MLNKSFLKYNAYALTMFPKSSWFKTAFMISFLLCALYIIVCIYSWIVFKNKQKPIKPKYAVPKVNKRQKNNKKFLSAYNELRNILNSAERNVFMPKVFLSPSTQEWNQYATSGNEELYMNLLADRMEPYLRSSGISIRKK